MLRAIGCTAALVCIVLASACEKPSPSSKSEPTTASSTPAAPAAPDQSKTFFPGTVATYGMNLSQTDRDNLAELYALRQIDPCGFVDSATLKANGHDDFSYTYTAEHTIGGGSQLSPIGGDGCTIAIPSTPMSLNLRVLPGESRANDKQFSPDVARPGVTTRTAPVCSYRVVLPLTKLAGAPRSMHDPVVELMPVKIADGDLDFTDTSLCQLGGSVAEQIANLVRDKGIPAYLGQSAGVKFLTSDPCIPATDLHAIGIEWKEPLPQAQWPVTWRHPGVCNLRLSDGTGGTDGSWAVVRYGLAAWSDKTLFDSRRGDYVPGKEVASEQDGVTLFDLSEPGRCFVVAKSGVTIEPINVGAGATDLPTPTPVVVVAVGTPEDVSCADEARRTAVAAVKRAT